MRRSGILLHISSLPSPYGIGTFGKEAYKFVDFLVETKQTYWQILPLGQTSYGDSPYQTFSAFAGNPYFIDLDFLRNIGLLLAEEIDIKVTNNKKVDYSMQYIKRYRILYKAFKRFDINNQKYRAFKEENKEWLNDYTLFMAIKDHFSGKSWQEWPEDIKKRDNKALLYYAEMLKDSVEFNAFLQYNFFEQWYTLKKYANDLGIKIIGDIPIYVALDSSDVWANPHLFDLNAELEPNYVAGVPPDGFSIDGQLWGNPLYRWDEMEKNNYHWWVKRIEAATNLYDRVRIDHFIGFENYYNVKYKSKTAVTGFWKKGPGMKLFNQINNSLGKLDIIAEDLGIVTPDVEKLLKDSGFPGMKLLQFAFYDKDSNFLPHNHPKKSVVYTGTHDNETSYSWFKSIEKKTLDFCLQYINNNNGNKVDSLIKCALSSVAETVIIPIQDYLGLDNKARMNEPSTVGGNWTFRTVESDFSEELKNKILSFTILYSRESTKTIKQ